jgi:hypothetical protein
LVESPEQNVVGRIGVMVGLGFITETATLADPVQPSFETVTVLGLTQKRV